MKRSRHFKMLIPSRKYKEFYCFNKNKEKSRKLKLS